jgi:hypothetical protein
VILAFTARAMNNPIRPTRKNQSPHPACGNAARAEGEHHLIFWMGI